MTKYEILLSRDTSTRLLDERQNVGEPPAASLKRHAIQAAA